MIVGLVVLVARRAAGSYAIEELASPTSHDVAERAWLIGSEILAEIGWAAIAYGVVIIAGSVLAGPTRYATAARTRLAPVLNERPGVVWAAVAGAYLLLILWGPTHALTTIWASCCSARCLPRVWSRCGRRRSASSACRWSIGRRSRRDACRGELRRLGDAGVREFGRLRAGELPRGGSPAAARETQGAVGSAVLGRLEPEDYLRFEVGGESLGAALAAEPGLLEAAERLDDAHRPRVDAELAGAHAAGDPLAESRSSAKTAPESPYGESFAIAIASSTLS